MSGNGRPPKSGPQTPASRAKAGLARHTHGVKRFLKTGLLPLRRACPLQPCSCGPGPGPDAVCPVLERARRERITMVMALPWIKPHHGDLVAEYVDDVIILKVINAWVTKAGMIRVEPDQRAEAGDRVGDLDLRAVLHRRWTIAAAAVRLADRLGLTPAAQKELGFDDALDVTPSLQEIVARYQEAPAPSDPDAEHPVPGGDGA